MEMFIIGIAGGSGSGKTTFINSLKEDCNKFDVSFISMDNYYLPRNEQIVDEEGVTNFDLPTSLDHDAFLSDLEKLKKGEVVTQLEYTFNNEKSDTREIKIAPAKIVIIEGLFIYHYKSVRELIDLKVFISAKENLKVIRRIKRDRIERNYPLDDVLYRYQHHVLPSFEKYILPYREQSDIIVNNNNKGFGIGLAVIKGFIFNQIL